jgi:hypothetical protein
MFGSGYAVLKLKNFRKRFQCRVLSGYRTQKVCKLPEISRII